MLSRPVRLEIQRLLRSRSLIAVTGIFCGVLLLTGLASWLDVRDHAKTSDRVGAEERRRWLDQGTKDPHSAAHYSIYAFKPARPLAVIDPGVMPFVGETVWLEAHMQNDLADRPQQTTPLFERMGLADPAGILQRYGPVAVFLLAFFVAGRERETGVLGLALGAAARPAIAVHAKAAAVTIVSSAALVAPVAAAGALSLATANDATIDDALRLSVWTLSAVAYVGILSAAAVAIAIAAPSSNRSLTGLLFIWTAWILSATPAASALSERLRPTPSFQDLKITLAREAPPYWSAETGEEQVATLLERYGAASPQELVEKGINLRGAQLDLAERHAQAVFDREIGGFYNRVADQDRMYAVLGWLSPAVAFDVVSAAVAGTDFTHHRHFIDAAEQYRRELVNRMNADLIPHVAVNGQEWTSDERLWAEVPAFDYARQRLSDGAAAAAVAAVALGAWLAVAFAGVSIAARRVRP
jgi:ABC-2 type transport system permease protein